MNKISIVTVTFNCKSSILKTLNSIISQRYANKEIIVIDGGSTDGTLSILQQFKSRLDILISEKDNGIFDAMNKAIRCASGDWIIFINSGDYFIDNMVLCDFFDKKKYNDDIGVVYGDITTTNGVMKMMPFFKVNAKFKGMGISHQAIFTRLDLAKKYMFSPKFKVAADYNMMNSIYQLGYKFVYKNRIIAFYADGGFSAINLLERYKEIAIICKAQHSCKYLSLKYKIIIKKILKKILNYDS